MTARLIFEKSGIKYHLYPNTAPLTSVATNAAAGESHNQFGFGKDPNEKLIRELGLVPLLQQYQASIA